MKLERNEAMHIAMIMKERGVGHCQECRIIFEKLKKHFTLKLE